MAMPRPRVLRWRSGAPRKGCYARRRWDGSAERAGAPGATMRHKGERLIIWALRVGVLCAILLIWSIAAGQVGRNLIASPTETMRAALRLIAEGRLFDAAADSLRVFLSGFAVAAVLGVLTGIAMGSFRLVGRTLDIFVYALAATPRVAFIPLVIVLLGLGIEAKAFIVFLGAIMPIIINTYTGVLAVDEELLEMARSVGAGRMRVFSRIVLPSALPFTVAGLRIGATIGLINTVVAELYTAVSGLGGLLAVFGNTFRMAEYFVIVLSLAAIGVMVTEALRLIEARLGRWRGRA